MTDRVDTLPAELGVTHSLNNGIDTRTIAVRLLDPAIAFSLFVIALLIYNATLTPGLSYLSPDGNELATVAYTLGLAHSTGYPLYTWLGKLFTFIPIGDVAHRVNLMSAAMGAGSIALMYGVLLILFERMRLSIARLHYWESRITSASIALVFAFSPTFWSQTGISEVYAPNLFMVALQTLLILKWAQIEENQPAGRGIPPSKRSLIFFGAFCLIFALSTGTHSSNLGFGLGYLVFVLAINWRFAFKPRALLIGVGLFILGMLQHLWLPYKAHTLTDLPMISRAPTTWEGFYNYTLGAFPQFKFAFPLNQVPDRIVIYLNLLRKEFSMVGILLGFAGMWVLLIRLPKRWWLLTLMYLVHVIFFTQYQVFDLEVFFIPAHFLFALYIGAGTWFVIGELILVAHQHLSRGLEYATYGVLIIALFLPPILHSTYYWKQNDRSSDVAINDFYINVFDMLPQDSVLLGRGGVFGYDMFYWQLVYELRPDVLIPQLTPGQVTSSDLTDRPIFSNQQTTNRGNPWGIPPELVRSDAWFVPVLVSTGSRASFGVGGHDLTLYHISDTPPDLFAARKDITPQMVIDEPLGGLVLVGYDLDATNPYPGGRVYLTFYWLGQVQAPGRIMTMLGETFLEAHQTGFGNLSRYVETIKPAPGSVLVENYWVVIPSTVDPGTYSLSVGVNDSRIDLGTIDIVE